jgi:hypothetical protein
VKIDKKAAEEKFDRFLMSMDDRLEWLQDQAKSAGIELGCSVSDCERLEQLFDLMSKALDKDQTLNLEITFARYLGEIVRVNYGGKWVLPLDDEKDINFNVPVITDHTPIEGLNFAPTSVMRAYSLRRKKGTLQRAIEAHTKPSSLDLDDLAEE